jgi:hypothetical protein
MSFWYFFILFILIAFIGLLVEQHFRYTLRKLEGIEDKINKN